MHAFIDRYLPVFMCLYFPFTAFHLPSFTTSAICDTVSPHNGDSDKQELWFMGTHLMGQILLHVNFI